MVGKRGQSSRLGKSRSFARAGAQTDNGVVAWSTGWREVEQDPGRRSRQMAICAAFRMMDEGVGDRVRRFRRHRKLTQQALADLARGDKGYISRLEAGEIAEPGIDLVEGLFHALRVLLRPLAETSSDSGGME